MTKEACTVNRCCPACNSITGLNQGQKNGFKMLLCRRCGTWYTSYLPAPEGSQDYDDYYHPENLTVPDFINQRLDEIVGHFAPYRQSNRLLDAGCGAGTLLQAAARAGWSAEGLEVSQPALEYVRGLGFNVFHGELAKAHYPDDHFDVITAVEVLEHVPDPRALVHEVTRILRPGGLFWATTPHGRGLSARLLGMQWSIVSPPEHLHLFSARGMRTLLTNVGFSKTEIATHGANPVEILHTLRNQHREHLSSRSDGNFNRVESSYRLNESLSKSPSRRALKNVLNQILNAGRLGDSLKIRAVL